MTDVETPLLSHIKQLVDVYVDLYRCVHEAVRFDLSYNAKHIEDLKNRVAAIMRTDGVQDLQKAQYKMLEYNTSHYFDVAIKSLREGGVDGDGKLPGFTSIFADSIKALFDIYDTIGGSVEGATGHLNREFSVPKSLQQDFARQIEYVSRHNKIFSIAVFTIDQPHLIDTHVGMLSTILKSALRIYDDPFYLGEGCFCILLKETNINGSLAAMGRLQEILLDMQSDKDSDSQLTVSCCLYAPEIFENIADIVIKVRNFLKDKNLPNMALVRYTELSPLKIYIDKKHNIKNT